MSDDDSIDTPEATDRLDIRIERLGAGHLIYRLAPNGHATSRNHAAGATNLEDAQRVARGLIQQWEDEHTERKQAELEAEEREKQRRFVEENPNVESFEEHAEGRSEGRSSPWFQVSKMLSRKAG